MKTINYFEICFFSSPPFQLAKRGWGEFFIRVKLYFHDHLLQKPIQIAHKLALDKEHSGLQKMGKFQFNEISLKKILSENEHFYCRC